MADQFIALPVEGPQIQDEGSVVVPEAGVLNFVGAGVTVTSTSPGVATITIPGGGTGTVTAVTASSPLQSSGGTTPNISFINQSANVVLAGPTSGGAAAPTFRSLVAADISPLFGNLTDAGTDGIVITGGTGSVLGAGTSIAQHVADSTHNGYLSSTDFNTFNGKQSTLTIGAFNNTSTANGLDITANVLSLHAADGTNPGAVSTTTQTFAGNKTFSGTVAISPASTTALTVNSTSFIVDSTNNALGVGVAPSSAAVIDIVNNSGTNKAVQETAYGSNAGFRTRRATGTLASPTASLTNDVIGFFSARGYGATGFAAASTGVLNMTAMETFTDTSMKTDAIIQATPTGSVTSAEAFRVSSTGVTLGPQGASTGTHFINGGLNFKISSSITSNTTLDGSYNIVKASAAGGSFVITLPTAVGIDGRTYTIIRTDSTVANNIQIVGTSSQTIAGFLSDWLLTQYSSLRLISDGANWQLLSANRIPYLLTSTSDTLTASVTGTTDTAFAGSFTFPANYFESGRRIQFSSGIVLTSSAAPPTMIPRAKFQKAGPVLVTVAVSSAQTPQTGQTGVGSGAILDISPITALSATASMETAIIASDGAAGTFSRNNTAQAVTMDTTAAQTLLLTNTYSANTAGNSITMRKYIINFCN